MNKARKGELCGLYDEKQHTPLIRPTSSILRTVKAFSVFM